MNLPSAEPVLLFDLGGVLVESRGLVELQALLPHVDPADIHARWQASPAVTDFESGRISDRAFAEAFVAEWGLPVEPPAFVGLFTSWVTGFYPGAIELLQRLRSRYTVACLSNTNAAHWGVLAHAAPLFDTCITSHTLGVMKPDPRAFDSAVRTLGVPASRICYFDDLPANVEAARAAGMRALQVRGLDETIAALRACGVRWDDQAAG